MDPSAGRSTPRIRPWINSAAAMMAPELPAEVQPSARPALHNRAHTEIEESGLLRTAWAGCSSIAMTWVQGTICNRGWLSSRGCTSRGRPTSEMSIPNSCAASAAPLTISAGA